MATDTSEAGLETIIVNGLTARGWLAGESRNYDRAACVDLEHLRDFVLVTQPKVYEAVDLGNDSPTRRQFLARLEKEIDTLGVIAVLRKGVRHNQHYLTLFYASPAPGNTNAAGRHALNRFRVTLDQIPRD